VSLGVPGPGDDLPTKAASVVRKETDVRPEVAIVLGSGLGAAIAGDVVEGASFSFVDLPGFPPVGVPGHTGRLTMGRLADVDVAVFEGRVHYYEGHGMDVLALVPRLANELGARVMVLTAAAGGLERGIDAGTVVILRDHLNLMGAAPLRGWRFPDGTPAFIGARDVYDPTLRELALARAEALGIRAVLGVYAAMSGPAYETPAEIEMLREVGATVVGMSVVPEAMPARALGMRVVGLCTLTNVYGEDVRHEEVVRVSNETAAAVGRLLVDLCPRLPSEGA
jgi:purine-nucleoside phosphorylase